MGFKFLGKKPPSTTHVEPDGSTNVEKHFCGALLEAANALEFNGTIRSRREAIIKMLRVSAGQEVKQ